MNTESIDYLIGQRVAVLEDTLRCAGRTAEEIRIEAERLRRELEADYAVWQLRTSYPDIPDFGVLGKPEAHRGI